MLIHVHKVIHLVVGTFEQGWRSWWIEGGVFHCQIVTEPSIQCDQTQGSSVRSIIKEGDALGLDLPYDRTQRRKMTGVRINTIQHPILLMWQCAEKRRRSERTDVSGHGGPDAFGQEKLALVPYWKWPDSGVAASGHPRGACPIAT